MNRFEAQNTLGLEENPDERDVRLAFYGIDKTVDPSEFWDTERLQQRIQNYYDRAKTARDFLLDSLRKAQGKSRFFKGKQESQAISATSEEVKSSRLYGLKRLSGIVVGYMNENKARRAWCIGIIGICIVLSFIVLRYLRATPRVWAFIVIAAAAITASTLLTTSIIQIRKSRAHALEIDGRIEELEIELGLREPEDSEEENAEHEGIEDEDTEIEDIEDEGDSQLEDDIDEDVDQPGEKEA